MKNLLFALALTLLLAGCATGPDSGPMAGDRYAIIYTASSRLADKIFPVVIDEIDGRNIADREYYRIKPGRHAIKARAVVVDRSLVGGLSRDISSLNNQPLVHHFLSGKRYFIGLKADSSRRADWHLVIWKEEEISDGLVDFDQ